MATRLPKLRAAKPQPSQGLRAGRTHALAGAANASPPPTWAILAGLAVSGFSFSTFHSPIGSLVHSFGFDAEGRKKKTTADPPLVPLASGYRSAQAPRHSPSEPQF